MQSQFGQRDSPSSRHPPNYAPPPEISQQTGGGSAASITSSLRQWRKKDYLEKQQISLENATTTSSIAVNPSENGATSHIARVAPHAYYPSRTVHGGGGNGDAYHYQHPYTDYNGSSQYKTTNTGPVKYSEITEALLPQALEQIKKSKEKDYVDLCSGSPQSHMKQYQEHNALKSSYPENVKQPYADTAAMHHQFISKEPQIHPFIQKQSQMHPQYMQKEQYQQYMPKYNIQPQYPQGYPTVPNNFLENLSKINPRMADSIINDAHLRETQISMYHNMEQTRSCQQPQRIYHSPSIYPNQSHNPRNISQPFNFSQTYNYNVKPGMQPTDPYSRMHQYQEPVSKYIPDYKIGMDQSPMANISSRRVYPDSMHMNYSSIPSKVSSNFPTHCAQLEYAQHYQHRRSQISQEYYSHNQPYKATYLQNSPLSPENSIPPESRTARKSSLKQFLENWVEEDMTGNLPDIIVSNNLNEMESMDNIKGTICIKSTGATGNQEQQQLFVLDTTEITNENLPQFLHLEKYEKLPDNIRGYYHSTNALPPGSRRIIIENRPAVAENSVTKLSCEVPNLAANTPAKSEASQNLENKVVQIHIIENNEPTNTNSTTESLETVIVQSTLTNPQEPEPAKNMPVIDELVVEKVDKSKENHEISKSSDTQNVTLPESHVSDNKKDESVQRNSLSNILEQFEENVQNHNFDNSLKITECEHSKESDNINKDDIISVLAQTGEKSENCPIEENAKEKCSNSIEIQEGCIISDNSKANKIDNVQIENAIDGSLAINNSDVNQIKESTEPQCEVLSHKSDTSRNVLEIETDSVTSKDQEKFHEDNFLEEGQYKNNDSFYDVRTPLPLNLSLEKKEEMHESTLSSKPAEIVNEDEDIVFNNPPEPQTKCTLNELEKRINESRDPVIVDTCKVEEIKKNPSLKITIKNLSVIKYIPNESCNSDTKPKKGILKTKNKKKRHKSLKKRSREKECQLDNNKQIYNNTDYDNTTDKNNAIPDYQSKFNEIPCKIVNNENLMLDSQSELVKSTETGVIDTVCNNGELSESNYFKDNCLTDVQSSESRCENIYRECDIQQTSIEEETSNFASNITQTVIVSSEKKVEILEDHIKTSDEKEFEDVLTSKEQITDTETIVNTSEQISNNTTEEIEEHEDVVNTSEQISNNTTKEIEQEEETQNLVYQIEDPNVFLQIADELLEINVTVQNGKKLIFIKTFSDSIVLNNSGPDSFESNKTEETETLSKTNIEEELDSNIEENNDFQKMSCITEEEPQNSTDLSKFIEETDIENEKISDENIPKLSQNDNCKELQIKMADYIEIKTNGDDCDEVKIISEIPDNLENKTNIEVNDTEVIEEKCINLETKSPCNEIEVFHSDLNDELYICNEEIVSSSTELDSIVEINQVDVLQECNESVVCPETISGQDGASRTLKTKGALKFLDTSINSTDIANINNVPCIDDNSDALSKNSTDVCNAQNVQKVVKNEQSCDKTFEIKRSRNLSIKGKKCSFKDKNKNLLKNKINTVGSNIKTLKECLKKKSKCKESITTKPKRVTFEMDVLKKSSIKAEKLQEFNNSNKNKQLDATIETVERTEEFINELQISVQENSITSSTCQENESNKFVVTSSRQFAEDWENDWDECKSTENNTTKRRLSLQEYIKRKNSIEQDKIVQSTFVRNECCNYRRITSPESPTLNVKFSNKTYSRNATSYGSVKSNHIDEPSLSSAIELQLPTIRRNSVKSEQFVKTPVQNCSQEYLKSALLSDLHSVNAYTVSLIKKNENLMMRFLDQQKLTDDELKEIRKIIRYKRLVHHLSTIKINELDSNMFHNYREKLHHNSYRNIDPFDFNLESKVQPAPDSPPRSSSIIMENRNRKRKRFRFLHSDDESPAYSTNEIPPVEKITSFNEKLTTAKKAKLEDQNYSVYQSDSQRQLTLVFKRSFKNDPKMQPFVKIERLASLDMLAKTNCCLNLRDQII